MKRYSFNYCASVIILGSACMTDAHAQTRLPDVHINAAKIVASRPSAIRVTRPVKIDAAPSRAAEPVNVASEPPVVTPRPPLQTMISQDRTVVTNAQIVSERAAAEDTVKLLERTPGVSVYEAGGIARLPVIHGMADDRIKIVTGGVNITSACANHMNPPLSYAGSSNVGKIEVYSGVVPVSKGGDSIGGTIIAEPRAPEFLPSKPAKLDESNGADPIDGSVTATQEAGKKGEYIPQPLFYRAGDLRHGPDGKLLVKGEFSSFYRSNNTGLSDSLTVNEATDKVALIYNGSWARGNNYKAGGNDPTVFSTNFITENHSATLAYQNDGQLFSLRGVYENIPYQGFVNQRMDMTGNRGWQAEGKYQAETDYGKVDARVYWATVAHEMGYLTDKQPNNMPMNTNGLDYGYAVGLDHKINNSHVLRVGSEYHGFRLNDYWQPIPPSGGIMTVQDSTTFMPPFQSVYPMTMIMMDPFTQWNVRNGIRNRLSHYGEVESDWTEKVSTLFGFRNDLVFSNAGEAAAYDPRNPAKMPMLVAGGRWRSAYMQNPDAVAADMFNQKNRQRTDVNIDITAQVRYKPDQNTTYEAGYSRKTRSPNLYERYSWAISSMSTAMINQVGDGNGYVGNTALAPEVAHTFSVTGSWRDPNDWWDAKATPYYTFVNNFINAQRVGSFNFAGFWNAGPYTFQELMYVNHAAVIYGFDLNGRLKFYEDPEYGRIQATGVVNYTYGLDLDAGNPQYCNATSNLNPNVTTQSYVQNQQCYLLANAMRQGDGLYHMMPLNGRLALEYKLGGWSSAFEVNVVAAKTHVSVQRVEQQTPAYGLVNLRSSYDWQNLRVDFAVENLVNTLYYPALGGFNMANYMVWTNFNYSRLPVPSPVAGMGRNVVAGITVKF